MWNKRVTIALALFCVMMMAVAMTAQPGDNPEKEAIHGLIAKCAEALQTQDWEKLASVCSDDWVHLAHTGERLNLAGVKSMFETHISDHTIEFSDVEIHVSDDANMAWATFNEMTEFKFDGNPVKQKAVFTAVFEKEAGDWKMQLLHRTVSVPPAHE